MNSTSAAAVLLLFGVVSVGVGCGGGTPAPTSESNANSQPATAAEEPLPPSRLDTELDPGIRAYVGEAFTGDLDQMVKRRLVRIGVPFNRSFYFVDKGVQRGIAYEYGRLIEERLNVRFNSKKDHDQNVHVYFIPVMREKLLSALLDGKVDMVTAQVTVRPSLEKVVDFTNPTRSNVNEVVVTGPGVPPVASVEDLAGRTVFVRQSSPY